MYRRAIIATCAAGVESPCGYENELSADVESACALASPTNRVCTCPNRMPDRSLNARYATTTSATPGAAAVVGLGEELQLADTGGPRDGDLLIGVHRERGEPVDVGGAQAGIVKGIAHGLGRQPQFTATGVLREVGGPDPDDGRLARKHQASPIVSVVVPMT
jgi:hypothetical protein